MGLLDTFLGSTPEQTQALGLLGIGLSRGDFAGGAQNAMGLLAGADDRKLKREMAQMEMEVQRMAMDKARREAASEQGLNSLMPQYFNAGGPAQGGTADVNAALPADMRIGAQPPIPARAPQFDVRGYTAAAVNQKLMNPLEALKLQKAYAPESQVNKLDVKDFEPASVARFQQTGNYADLKRMDKLHFADTGGAIKGLNPFTAQEVGGIQKTGNPFESLILSDGQGGMQPNSPLINAKSQIARAGASNVSVNTGQKGLDNELKIRSDFRSEPIYKAHQDVISAHSQISQSLKQASPAGDLAGATKLMKILDPGSVVRESELGMAMAASGLLDRATNYANMVVSGQKLTPTQRKDFQQLADSLYGESIKQYNNKRSEYGKFATDYGLDSERILGPGLTSPKVPSPAAQPGGATPKPGAGVRFLGFE